MLTVTDPYQANILNILTRHNEYTLNELLYQLQLYSKVDKTKLIHIVLSKQITTDNIEDKFKTIIKEMNQWKLIISTMKIATWMY